jgi:hypothetical protein
LDHVQKHAAKLAFVALGAVALAWLGLPELVRRTKSEPMGTEHEFVLLGASHQQGWVIGCQARADTNHDGKIAARDYFADNGDELVPYLFVGPGEGEVIDEFVGRDPTSRYLGFVQNRRLYILDSQTGTRRDLSALIGKIDYDQPFPRFPELSFDSAGRAVTVRHTLHGDEVLLIDLAAWSVEVVDRAPFIGEAYFDYFDHATLKVAELSEDTDGNGVVEPSRRRLSFQQRRCYTGTWCSGRYFGDNVGPERVVPIPERTNRAPRERWCTSDESEGEIVRSNRDTALVGTHRGTPPDRYRYGPVYWADVPARTCRDNLLRFLD